MTYEEMNNQQVEYLGSVREGTGSVARLYHVSTTAEWSQHVADIEISGGKIKIEQHRLSQSSPNMICIHLQCGLGHCILVIIIKQVYTRR